MLRREELDLRKVEELVKTHNPGGDTSFEKGRDPFLYADITDTDLEVILTARCVGGTAKVWAEMGSDIPLYYKGTLDVLTLEEMQYAARACEDAEFYMKENAAERGRKKVEAEEQAELEAAAKAAASFPQGAFDPGRPPTLPTPVTPPRREPVKKKNMLLVPPSASAYEDNHLDRIESSTGAIGNVEFIAGAVLGWGPMLVNRMTMSSADREKAAEVLAGVPEFTGLPPLNEVLESLSLDREDASRFQSLRNFLAWTMKYLAKSVKDAVTDPRTWIWILVAVSKHFLKAFAPNTMGLFNRAREASAVFKMIVSVATGDSAISPLPKPDLSKRAASVYELAKASSEGIQMRANLMTNLGKKVKRGVVDRTIACESGKASFPDCSRFRTPPSRPEAGSLASNWKVEKGTFYHFAGLASQHANAGQIDPRFLAPRTLPDEAGAKVMDHLWNSTGTPGKGILQNFGNVINQEGLDEVVRYSFDDTMKDWKIDAIERPIFECAHHADIFGESGMNALHCIEQKEAMKATELASEGYPMAAERAQGHQSLAATLQSMICGEWETTALYCVGGMAAVGVAAAVYGIYCKRASQRKIVFKKYREFVLGTGPKSLRDMLARLNGCLLAYEQYAYYVVRVKKSSGAELIVKDRKMREDFKDLTLDLYFKTGVHHDERILTQADRDERKILSSPANAGLNEEDFNMKLVKFVNGIKPDGTTDDSKNYIARLRDIADDVSRSLNDIWPLVFPGEPNPFPSDYQTGDAPFLCGNIRSGSRADIDRQEPRARPDKIKKIEEENKKHSDENPGEAMDTEPGEDVPGAAAAPAPPPAPAPAAAKRKAARNTRGGRGGDSYPRQRTRTSRSINSKVGEGMVDDVIDAWIAAKALEQTSIHDR